MSSSARRAARRTMVANLCAGLAHELRNPLNSAGLQLEVAARQIDKLAGEGARSARTAIDNVAVELERAAALLDDILEFARPRPLALAPVELGAMAQRAVQRALPTAQAHDVTVRIETAAPVALEADARQLEPALFNLICNGIEACAGQPNREVVVRLFVLGDNAVVEVADSGVGLGDADAHIFDAFYTTKANGTGLGLAIVERAVSDHGGTVSIERTAAPTVFRVQVPRHAATDADSLH